ncbi:MAG: hypothetical protein L0154_26045 [Chloroflexi bacterium]|nr:hypothetical protein [Chloroflexota bacterium]
MPSLNTFGAIMTFAINLENDLVDYYRAVGDTERAAEADKRRSNLERVRRENVVEITLEAIDGLDEADYAFNFDDTSEAGQSAVETIAARFYEDVAPKINVRQAQRVLSRYAGQHSGLANA